MSDGKDSLKDKPISRREFLKLMGAGSLFLGLGAFGIPNILKNIREASAINQTAPPVLPGVMSNNKQYNSNDMNKSEQLRYSSFSCECSGSGTYRIAQAHKRDKMA